MVKRVLKEVRKVVVWLLRKASQNRITKREKF